MTDQLEHIKPIINRVMEQLKGGDGMKEFKKELEELLNSHSIENECDMPDFLLAEMIVGFIQAVGQPIKKTLDWHGCDSVCHPGVRWR